MIQQYIFISLTLQATRYHSTKPSAQCFSAEVQSYDKRLISEDCS